MTVKHDYARYYTAKIIVNASWLDQDLFVIANIAVIVPVFRKVCFSLPVIVLPCKEYKVNIECYFKIFLPIKYVIEYFKLKQQTFKYVTRVD